ncbi:MAG: hypothetical protein ACE5DI_01530 [Candidatus Micrarchaeia archaeon]
MNNKIFALLTALVLTGCVNIGSNVTIQNNTLDAPSLNGSVDVEMPNATLNISQTDFSLRLPNSIKVCIIGQQNQEYENVLQENLTLVNFNKSIRLQSVWLSESSSRLEIEECSVIIAKDDSTGRICGRIMREAVKKRATQNRAGFILTQNACTLTDDPAVSGWDLSWKGFVPLKMDNPSNEPIALGTETLENGKFVVEDSTDPAIGVVKNFNFSNWTVTKTDQTANGKIVALLRTDPVKTTQPAYAGIVRKTSLLPQDGYVYYFSYDPTKTPTILRLVLELQAKRHLLPTN